MIQSSEPREHGPVEAYTPMPEFSRSGAAGPRAAKPEPRAGHPFLLVLPGIVAAAVAWSFHRESPGPAAAGDAAPAPPVSRASAAAQTEDLWPAAADTETAAAGADPLVPMMFALEGPAVPARPEEETGRPRRETPYALRAQPPARPEEETGRPLMVERSPFRPALARLESAADFYRTGPVADGLRTMRLTPDRAVRGATLLAWAGGGTSPAKSAPAKNSGKAAAADDDGWGTTHTDLSRAAWTCALGGGCGRDSAGRFFFKTEDGTKVTQLSYDQSKPLGERNLLLMETPTGTRMTLRSSPLVFDLKGSGVRSSDRVVRYDLSGDGRLEEVHDIASDAGVLVFDGNGDGLAGATGRELFGDVTDLDGDGKPDGYADGFEALAALAAKARRQGVLPSGAAQPDRLSREDLADLGRVYGLGMRIGGLFNKTVLLAQAGVREIVLSGSPSRLTKDFDGQGNDVVKREGAFFVRQDGSKGAYEDVFFTSDAPTLRKVAFK
ncbi:MAG: hypothetical protein HY927_04290 [Elusimicrobia bacterium]|nr:hypothetical protein [Elusimicrobiota bacterium]